MSVVCPSSPLAANDEAREQLVRALDFYRSVRATRYISECEALLGDASEIPA